MKQVLLPIFKIMKLKLKENMKDLNLHLPISKTQIFSTLPSWLGNKVVGIIGYLFNFAAFFGFPLISLSTTFFLCIVHQLSSRQKTLFTIRYRKVLIGHLSGCQFNIKFLNILLWGTILGTISCDQMLKVTFQKGWLPLYNDLPWQHFPEGTCGSANCWGCREWSSHT